MSKQIKPSVTNPTIADVYQMIDEGKLILRPEFQRKFVWTPQHQDEFIATISLGLPFPEIYVCQGEVDIENMKTTRNVIDGQQRLTTIKNYIEGKFEKPPSLVPTYEDLSKEEKSNFISYEIVMRDIGDVDEDTVKEIFRRINLTKFKLDDIEIQNAIYDGEFIQTAKDILDNISLEDYGVLKESEFTRMADLHFILLVISTIEIGGYFARSSEVEPMIAKYNGEYPNKENMLNHITEVFDIITELELPVDSMWFRKSNFFTLVVEIAFHIDRIPKDFKRLLLSLEEKVMEAKKDPSLEYAEYYSYMYQGTHSRAARVIRAKYFQRDCLEEK